MESVGIRALKQNASALVKLIVPEDESEALRRWRDEAEVHVLTADLTRTALMRAVRRPAPEKTSGVILGHSGAR